MATRFLLKDVRLAYGHGLWKKSKPPKADAGAKEKYRIALILPKTHPQFKELEKVIMAEMTAKFGAKAALILKAAEAGQKSCLRDGNIKEGEGFEGNWFVATNSEVRPSVFNRDRSPITEDDGIVYSGCYVNCSFDVYAFDNASKGNSAGLRGVQFVRDGDAFGGGKAADDTEFEELGVSESDEETDLTA
jgi:hypothetical protein